MTLLVSPVLTKSGTTFYSLLNYIGNGNPGFNLSLSKAGVAQARRCSQSIDTDLSLLSVLVLCM